MNEQLTLTNEAVRLPLTGIPLAQMLAEINRDGRFVHYN